MLYKFNPVVWDRDAPLRSYASRRGLNSGSLFTLFRTEGIDGGEPNTDAYSMVFKGENGYTFTLYSTEVLPVEGQLNLEDWM